jgi:hypothetical protein
MRSRASSEVAKRAAVGDTNQTTDDEEKHLQQPQQQVEPGRSMRSRASSEVAKHAAVGDTNQTTDDEEKHLQQPQQQVEGVTLVVPAAVKKARRAGQLSLKRQRRQSSGEGPLATPGTQLVTGYGPSQQDPAANQTPLGAPPSPPVGTIPPVVTTNPSVGTISPPLGSTMPPLIRQACKFEAFHQQQALQC